MTESHDSPSSGAAESAEATTDNVRLIADLRCENYPFLESDYPESHLTEEIADRLDRNCPQCQGTGYRFPWLWRECIGYYNHRRLSCELAGCGGYALIEAEMTDALLRVAREQQWQVDFTAEGAVVIRDAKSFLLGEADTLAAACCKALGLA